MTATRSGEPGGSDGSRSRLRRKRRLADRLGRARDAAGRAGTSLGRFAAPPARVVGRALRAVAARGPLILIGTGALFFLGMVAFIFLVPLPEPSVPVASQVLDRNGELVGTIFSQNRTPVPLSQVPDVLQRGIVAVEDERFFAHHGFDIVAIVRAAVRNLQAGTIVEGGSTITSQLARTLYLNQETTLSRKVVEALLAVKLERVYTKQEILELYLNQIYLGNGAYGVETASRTFFGKSVSELSLAESAMIAGLPAGPEIFSPFNSPERAVRRRNLVLDLWATAGIISADQAAEAKETPILLASVGPPRAVGSYFTDYVLSLIEQWAVEQGLNARELLSNLYVGGYRIFTTLDVDYQRAAERAVEEWMPEGTPDANGVTQPQVGLLAMDPTNGHILAMVGGRSFGETQLNRAVPPGAGREGMVRQPGSAFKPFLYTVVLDSGFPLLSTQVCEPVGFPSGSAQPYRPEDYGRVPFHFAPLTIRDAIRISDNVVAVKWANQIGINRVREAALRLGITSPLTPDLSLALGSSEVSVLEMARAYSTFANGGLRVEPLALLRLEDRYGKVLIQNNVRVTRAIQEPVAYLVNRLLQEPFRARGTAAHLLRWFSGRPVAGKTGTTDNQFDAWFVGYTPQVVCATWVGFDTPQQLTGYGGTLAGPVWANFMAGAHADLPVVDFFEPPGVVHVEVCAETGLLPNPSCPRAEEIFIAGTQPRSRHWQWHRRGDDDDPEAWFESPEAWWQGLSPGGPGPVGPVVDPPMVEPGQPPAPDPVQPEAPEPVQPVSPPLTPSEPGADPEEEEETGQGD